MILAAINSRVGTLIPPARVTSGEPTTAMTTNAFTSMDVTQSLFTSEMTAASMTSTTAASGGTRYLSDDPDRARIMIGTALALVAGLVQLAMAIFHVGYVTVYLSDSIVQGFTTGCAIHIITSQIPSLLGIKIKTVSGQSKVIKVR